MVKKMQIVFAWCEGIVVCWGFTEKGHNGTFWSHRYVLYFNRVLDYLSVPIYQTYQLADLTIFTSTIVCVSLPKK